MTALGWTVADAFGQFADAGMPVDQAGFRDLVKAARRLGHLKPIGEKRKPPGSAGGRGEAIYAIADMQRMHADNTRWLLLPDPPAGDT